MDDNFANMRALMQVNLQQKVFIADAKMSDSMVVDQKKGVTPPHVARPVLTQIP